jgi:hypothetical protein
MRLPLLVQSRTKSRLTPEGVNVEDRGPASRLAAEEARSLAELAAAVEAERR